GAGARPLGQRGPHLGLRPGQRLLRRGEDDRPVDRVGVGPVGPGGLADDAGLEGGAGQRPDQRFLSLPGGRPVARPLLGPVHLAAPAADRPAQPVLGRRSLRHAPSSTRCRPPPIRMVAMADPMPLDLYADPVRADPYPLLQELRETAPVLWVSQQGLESWIVTRYDEVRSILADPRFIKQPATVPDALRRFKAAFGSEGE